MSNSLIHESSPYLLQHAENPVDWKPWKDQILENAENEGKLIIVSIGYAACHWCHVMEHESFEDPEVAKVMNDHFCSIKVDREERPDVDHAYMNAVQIMTGQGGWPMNVVCLPNGTPVWGGTYFKKEQWISALQQLQEMYKSSPKKLEEYASRMKEGLDNLEIIKVPTNLQALNSEWFESVLQKYKRNFDYMWGGFQGAPKFITPSNYLFLLRYSYQTGNDELREFVLNSLTKFSFGGIYDHLQGGFSRYSVDQKWHIPHFEKMLYDNSQLVILYSEAFKLTGNSWFEEVIKQTLEFIKNELTSPETGFYSSLDADSLNENHKLEEGAYYVWQKPQLEEILGEDFELFSDYYNINSFGKWEDENYVLIRTKDDDEIAREFNITLEKLQSNKQNWLKTLIQVRNQKTKPRLDDKQLTSWNAMMLQAYLVAYKTFNIPAYLETARNSAEFLQKKVMQTDFSLYHSYKNGTASINAYLEDYAAVISAFLEFYTVELEDKFLHLAENITEYVLTNFYDDEKGLFSFTSQEDRPLVTRNFELTDSVIPSSNSVMARNLLKLAKYTGKENYDVIYKKMLYLLTPKIIDYPQGYSNWLSLAMDDNMDYLEVVITGPNYLDNVEKLNAFYFPHILIDGDKEKNSRPLLQGRVKEKEDLIYVCKNGSCQLPVKNIGEAVDLIHLFKKS